MSIRTNGISEIQASRLGELMSILKEGKIRKWRLPNSSEAFDPTAAFESFKQFLQLGITRKLMEKLKGTYGS